MSTALRNRIIPHTPALPRAFIGHGECGREYDGAFSDLHCGGVPWDRQSGPVRSNTPQAGADGYEMGNEPRGIDRWEVAGTIIGVLVIILLAAALIWGCWWAACRALERGPWWT